MQKKIIVILRKNGNIIWSKKFSQKNLRKAQSTVNAVKKNYGLCGSQFGGENKDYSIAMIRE